MDPTITYPKMMRYNTNAFNTLSFNEFVAGGAVLLMDETLTVTLAINQLVAVLRELLRRYFGLELQEEILRDYFHMYMRNNPEARKYFYGAFGHR